MVAVLLTKIQIFGIRVVAWFGNHVESNLLTRTPIHTRTGITGNCDLSKQQQADGAVNDNFSSEPSHSLTI